MSEAIETSVDLLNNVAKKVPQKNAVAFKILKHSGHFFEGMFVQDTDEYNRFTNLLKFPD